MQHLHVRNILQNFPFVDTNLNEYKALLFNIILQFDQCKIFYISPDSSSCYILYLETNILDIANLSRKYMHLEHMCRNTILYTVINKVNANFEVKSHSDITKGYTHMSTHLNIIIKRCTNFEKANNLNFHSISILYNIKFNLNMSLPIGYYLYHSLSYSDVIFSANIILFHNEATKFYYDICEYIILNDQNCIYLTASLSYINVAYNQNVTITSVRILHICKAY